VYKVKLHEIEDTKASQLGIYVPNILELEENESIIYMHITQDYEGYFCFGFENGKISRVAASVYETKTNRKKLIKAYANQSPCIGMAYVQNEDCIRVLRSDDKGAILPVALIPEKQKRDTQGVQVITLIKNTHMKGVRVEPFKENAAKEGVKKIPASCKVLD
jgi:DNA gyrase subunit A